VAKSTAGRDGAFIEVIGTYNPVTQPKQINIKEDRALHWLLSGAQPTETTAVLFSKLGILDKYFEQRPAAKKSYKFLDKRTGTMSVQSVIKAAPVEAKVEEAPAPAPVEEEVIAEAPAAEEVVAEETAPAVEEAPAAEETPAGEESNS
jgi:small subunit ribosomal protein S16